MNFIQKVEEVSMNLSIRMNRVQKHKIAMRSYPIWVKAGSPDRNFVLGFMFQQYSWISRMWRVIYLPKAHRKASELRDRFSVRYQKEESQWEAYSGDVLLGDRLTVEKVV